MPSNLTRGIVAGLAGYARAKIALAQEEREDQRALLDAEVRKREFDLRERLGLSGLEIQREQVRATERSTQAQLRSAEKIQELKGSQSIEQIKQQMMADLALGAQSQEEKLAVAKFQAGVRLDEIDTQHLNNLSEQRLGFRITQILQEEKLEGERETATAVAETQKEGAIGAAQARAQAAGTGTQSFEVGNTLITIDKATGREINRIKLDAIGRRPNETQSKFILFAPRLKESGETITNLEKQPGFIDKVAGKLNIDRAFNFASLGRVGSKELKRYFAAKQNWVNAYVRMVSGAAITEDEARNEAEAFFPKPGESSAPLVIADKQQQRAQQEEKFQFLAGIEQQEFPDSQAQFRPGLLEDRYPELEDKIFQVRREFPGMTQSEIEDWLLDNGVITERR